MRTFIIIALAYYALYYEIPFPPKWWALLMGIGVAAAMFQDYRELTRR